MKAGRWLLLHLFSRHPLRSQPPPPRWQLVLLVALLLALLLESVLLVLVAQALRSALTPSS